MEMIKRKGESYQHAAARTVFKHWLDTAYYDGNSAEFGPFDWRGRVHEEYPFIVGINEPMQNTYYDGIIPSYEELAAAGTYPSAIADIAIEHKGMIVYAVEIVHKHDVSEEKIAKLKALKCCLNMEIWRIEAHWILAQVDKPIVFPLECIRQVG